MEVCRDTLRVVANEASALSKKLHVLSLKTFPSVGLNRFVDGELLTVNDALRDIFVAEAEALERNDGSHRPDRVAQTFALWSVLSGIVDAVDGADMKSHPLEFMQYLKDLVRVFDGDDVEFSTSAAREMNFSITEVWQSFKPALKEYADIDRRTSTRFVHFTFPELHKDNALLGAIYAHELGHYVDRCNTLTEKIYVEAAKHPIVQELAKASNTPEQDVIGFLRGKFLGPWIREILADTFGIHLLGPAFHFAALEIDAFSAGRSFPTLKDVISESHPSSALRAAHRINMLRTLGFLDVCPKDVQGRITDANAWWHNAQRVYKDPAHKDMCQAVEPILLAVTPLIVQTVEGIIPKSVRLSVSDLGEVVPRLVDERLAWLIPPNELDGAPVSPAAILNAGWLAYFTRLEVIKGRVKGFESRGKHYELMELINNLVRYALHVSRVQRRFAEIDRASS